MRVGIQSVGLFLPPEIRTNDWWSPDVVASWAAQRRQPLPPDPALLETEGARRVLAALAQQTSDPFQGTVRRHIMPKAMTLLDMEEHAAHTAITRAQIDPATIDLVLTSTTVPDYLLGNPACGLHERLKLPRRCFALHTDVAAGAFQAQLEIAEAMIVAGRARCALLVQSCAPSRIIDPLDPNAPYFGDAATAMIVGPVDAAHGIETSVTFTDGRYGRTLIASVPGGKWYEGPATLMVGDPEQTRAVFLQTADLCKVSIDHCLGATARTVADIDFVAMHQGAAWLRRVIWDYTGLADARSVEIFGEMGYLFASTIPASLAIAEDQQLLSAGDRVILVGGGTGMTYGATQLVWGRG